MLAEQQNGTGRETRLTPEQRRQMREEMLLQAEAKLENARVNYLMARAAFEALQADEG
jgi:hypothetical protein